MDNIKLFLTNSLGVLSTKKYSFLGFNGVTLVIFALFLFIMTGFKYSWPELDDNKNPTGNTTYIYETQVFKILGIIWLVALFASLYMFSKE